jgi:hypothetical protein
MYHHSKISTVLDTVRVDDKFFSFQRLYSTLMKNAGILLTWRMECYQHAVMWEKSEVSTPVSFHV